MKPHRNPHEDERLGLSRRSFFFFGAVLAAKPEIVVKSDHIKLAPPSSPLIVFLQEHKQAVTKAILFGRRYENEYLSRQGKLHELDLVPGDVLVLPSRTTNLGFNPVMARIDRFDAAGRPLLTALCGRGATTREIDCGEWMVVGQAYREDA